MKERPPIGTKVIIRLPTGFADGHESYGNWNGHTGTVIAHLGSIGMEVEPGPDKPRNLPLTLTPDQVELAPAEPKGKKS